MLKIQNNSGSYDDNCYLKCLTYPYLNKSYKLKHKINHIGYCINKGLSLNNEKYNNINFKILKNNGNLILKNNSDEKIFKNISKKEIKITKDTNIMINNNTLNIKTYNQNDTLFIDYITENNINISNTILSELNVIYLKDLKKISISDINNLFNDNFEVAINILKIINNRKITKYKLKYFNDNNTIFDIILNEDNNEATYDEFNISYSTDDIRITFNNELFSKFIPVIYKEITQKKKIKIGDFIKVNDLLFIIEPFKVYSYTNIGSKSRNQDYISINYSMKTNYNLLYSLFCVCDGHNGSLCSYFIANNINKILLKYLNNSTTIKDNFLNDNFSIKRVEKLFKELFENCFDYIDNLFKYNFKDHCRKIGTTCSLILVIKKYDIIITAHIGDSKAIGYSKYFENKIFETEDHCATSKASSLNLVKKHFDKSDYSKTSRVGGVLKISRAFGDFNYKSNNISNPLTNIPDVNLYKMDKGYIIIGTDGFFENINYNNFFTKNKLKNESVYNIGKMAIKKIKKKDKIDNFSVIIFSL